MKILKTSDRVHLKHGDITIVIRPMDYENRARVLSLVRIDGGETRGDHVKMAHLTLKVSLEDIKGVYDVDGEEYRLSRDATGDLSDECAHEVAALLMGTPLFPAASAAANLRFPDIDGVEVSFPKKN